MGKRGALPDDTLPTVVKGDLRFFSVSSLKTFRLCPRNWWFDKVKGLPTKQTKGAKLGDESHQRVEHFMLTGEDVRAPIEREGAHLLEPYRLQRVRAPATVQVEAALAPRIVTPGGAVMRGFTDLLVEPGASPWGDGLPEFVDHKFMRNFDYVLDEAELRDDLQGLGYAAWGLFQRWPGLDRVRFTHHQHAREGRDRKPRRVSVVHDLTHVRASWDRIAHDVDVRMRDAAKQHDEALVPVGDTVGDEEGKGTCCDAYGRCSFRSVCSASPENRFANLFAVPPKETPSMSLLRQVLNPAASANTQTAAQTATPPVPAPAPVQQPASNSAPTVYGKCEKCSETVTAENGARLTSGKIVHVEGCNPKPAPAPEPAPSSKILAKNATVGSRYYLGGDKAGMFNALAGSFAVFELLDGTPHTIKGDAEIELLVEPKADPPAAPVQAPQQPAQTAQNVGGSVLPPDAPASNPGAVDASKAVEQEKQHNDANPPDGGATASTEQTGETEKKSRGGSRKKAAESAAPSAVVNNVQVQQLAGLPEYTLIVGASVSRPIAQPLNPLIQQVAQQLADAAKVVDVRSADKSSPLAYGGWKGALATGVEQQLTPGIYYVEPGELADVVIERLSAKAVIIRGR